MQNAALERMAAGDIRDASDKAWCAAKRAADAMILARTGKLHAESPDTSRALIRLSVDDPEIGRLRDRYATRRDMLHGDCFYLGLCEPAEGIEAIIRDTADFIREAQALAT